MEVQEGDFRAQIIKSACEEQDALDKRRYKIARILEPVRFEDENERGRSINAFLKSKMEISEIEAFAKWRIENEEVGISNKIDDSKKSIPGVS
ncbi:MAG TPA: hypothetical protein VH415_01400 [Nitrososphaeraceae archaeon]|jgi:hypothetical protein